MSSLTRPLMTGLLVVALVGLAGCGDSSDDPATTASDPASSATTSTAPSDQASRTPTGARADFCAQIPAAKVRAAIDGRSVYDESWQPGQPADLIGGAHENGAEYGCTWTAKDGTTVTAWMFARPVTAAEATQLVRKDGPGCERRRAPQYGEPSSTVQCINDDDTVTRSQGLFGDAWIGCSLQTPGILTKLDRANAWCATVRGAALT
jgi:hypothetical protein